jgi:hypothetical protein
MSELPNEARYKRVQNFNDSVMARHTTRISPFNAGTFGPGNVDRLLFNIPSEQGMELDMDTLMFHCDITPSFVGNGAINTTDIYFCNSIESIIHNLKIRKGTQFLIEDIQRYNYVDSMLMNMVASDHNNCPGKALMGIGNTIERILYHRSGKDANGAIVNVFDSSLAKRNYAFPLRLSGVSNYSGLLSTSLIDSVTAFQIEIELAPANECMVCYTRDNVNNIGAPIECTYTLTNCYMTYDLVRMEPSYHSQLAAAITRGQSLTIPFKTFRTSLYSLPSGTNAITYNINDTVKSLNALYISFFAVNEQAKFNIAGRDRLHFPNLKTAQLQVGSFYYPLTPLDCTNQSAHAFIELQKALGLGYLRSESAGVWSFSGQDFIGPRYGTVQNLYYTGANNTGGISSVDIYPAYAHHGSNWTAYPVTVALDPNNNYARSTANPQADLANANLSNTGLRYMREVCAVTPSNFILAFNMKKVLDISEGDVAGVDLAASGSGLVSLRLEFQTGGAPTNYNVIIASLYDAVLEIQNNQQVYKVE